MIWCLNNLNATHPILAFIHLMFTTVTQSLYISKNNPHCFKDSKVKNKEVHTYTQPGSRCCLVKFI